MKRLFWSLLALTTMAFAPINADYARVGADTPLPPRSGLKAPPPLDTASVGKTSQTPSQSRVAVMDGVVTATSLNVRTGAGTDHPAVDWLSQMDEVQIVQVERRRGETWYLVEYVGGLGEGWVSADWVYVEEDVIVAEVSEPLSANACGDECWVTNETRWTPSPQHIVGNAVMYAPGLMEASAIYNGFNLDGFAGGVAMASLGDVGEVVWLRNPQVGQWEGPYLVVDVSGRTHMWMHIVERKQSVEVDFDTAVRWGMAWGTYGNWGIIDGGLADVEVYRGLVPPDENSSAVDYREWFLSTAQLGRDNNVAWSPAYAHFTNFVEYGVELSAAYE